jgi:hypothetical protein
MFKLGVIQNHKYVLSAFCGEKTEHGDIHPTRVLNASFINSPFGEDGSRQISLDLQF